MFSSRPLVTRLLKHVRPTSRSVKSSVIWKSESLYFGQDLNYLNTMRQKCHKNECKFSTFVWDGNRVPDYRCGC